MIRRSHAPYVLGAMAAVSIAGVASAGEYVGGRVITRIGDRCTQLGEGFVDVGNGICGRVNRSLRIYVGPRNAPANAWSGGGTASAAMRTDGMGMLPGVTSTQHLRVRGNLDSYSPFR